MLQLIRKFFISVFFYFYVVTVQATTYSNVFFFGDSLTDTGSPVVIGFVTNPPFSGNTYSDGPAWSTTFANNLGFSDVYGVNNFAVGGARSFDLNNDATAYGGVSQVNQYLTVSAGIADANALYVINIGVNDFFDSSNTGLPPSQVITSVLSNISTAISTLQNAGAQHFLLMDATDLVSVSPNTADEIKALVRSVGLDLQAQFATEFSNHLVFSQLDFFDAMKAIHLDSNGNVGITPGETAAYCLNNVTCNANAPAGDSSSFLLFDTIHPTKSVNEALGNAVTAAVVMTTPTTVPFPVMSLLLLAVILGNFGFIFTSKSSRSKLEF